MGNSENPPMKTRKKIQVSLPLRQRWCLGRVARLRGSPSGFLRGAMVVSAYHGIPQNDQFCGRMMGKVWEKYGKTMGKVWENMEKHGKHMEKYGKIWKIMEKHMEKYGKSMGHSL